MEFATNNRVLCTMAKFYSQRACVSCAVPSELMLKAYKLRTVAGLFVCGERLERAKYTSTTEEEEIPTSYGGCTGRIIGLRE